MACSVCSRSPTVAVASNDADGPADGVVAAPPPAAGWANAEPGRNALDALAGGVAPDIPGIPAPGIPAPVGAGAGIRPPVKAEAACWKALSAWVPTPTAVTPENLRYLRTKRDRMGHDLPTDVRGA